MNEELKDGDVVEDSSCDNCCANDLEIRRMSLSRVGGWAFLCHGCWNSSLGWRVVRNQKLEGEAKFLLPSWESFDE